MQERHVDICAFNPTNGHDGFNGHDHDLSFKSHKNKSLSGHDCQCDSFDPCNHNQLAYDQNLYDHDDHKSGFWSICDGSHVICHGHLHDLEWLCLKRNQC